MYTSEKIENFLQSVKFAGDADKATIQAAFYITPVSYDLLYEVDDRIAKQLFRREGKDHAPVAELGKVVLNLGELGAHNLEIFPHPEADGAGQMIPACRIGEVSCDKLFADSNQWSLIWKVTMPLDTNSLALCHKYYKKSCFITLVKQQDELFDENAPHTTPVGDDTVESGVRMHCQVCNEAATYIGNDLSVWCDKHVAGAVGVEVKKIVYTEAVTS